MSLLADADHREVVLGPSSKYLSLDPILAIPGLTAGLRAFEALVIAVSPLIARGSVGPTAKIMRELGLEVSFASIAKHCEHCVDGPVINIFRMPRTALNSICRRS